MLPSGHSTRIFALASLIAGRLGVVTIVPLPVEIGGFAFSLLRSWRALLPQLPKRLSLNRLHKYTIPVYICQYPSTLDYGLMAVDYGLTAVYNARMMDIRDQLTKARAARRKQTRPCAECGRPMVGAGVLRLYHERCRRRRWARAARAGSKGHGR